MNVKIRKLTPDAQIPAYATPGAAGFDLVAVEDAVIAPGETKRIPLGLSFEIPPGYVMIICMRSGIALKTKLRQPNGIGVIDWDYRGEVAMMFDNISSDTGDDDFVYHADGLDGNPAGDEYHPFGTYIIRKGDRVAQAFIQPLPRATFTVVDELGDTERGTGGFGSSGVRAEVNV
jgi:dUTP pyrophosphatase